MALAFRIKDPDDFGMLFSAYDEYTSILNSLFGRVLTPNDDYYTAPWCFMPTSDNSGFVVFTCQVPWLEHTSTSDDCIKKSLFRKARKMMEDNWYRDNERQNDIPFVNYPEDMQKILRLRDSDLITFTEDGCYPDKNDISQELEENAVIETCLAMGWQIPLEWREERVKWRDQRLKYQELDSMVFDLAAYDATKKAFIHDEEDSHKRMKYTLPPLPTTTQGDDGNQQNNPGDNDSKPYDPANYQPQMPSLPSVSNDQSWEEGGEEKKEEEEHDTPSAAVAEHLDNTCVISHLNVFYGSDDNNEEEVGPKHYYC